MNQEEIGRVLKNCGAWQEGHFLLSSGKHSDQYIQCAQLFQYPDWAEKICRALTTKIPNQVDVVAAPALGGIVMGYELARQLKARAIFAERTSEGVFSLRRGFFVNPGETVIISEDVVTTGKSVLEVATLVKEARGKIVGIASVINRAGTDNPFNYPFYYLARLELPLYDADSCPLCQQGIPAVKPGSRPQIK